MRKGRCRWSGRSPGTGRPGSRDNPARRPTESGCRRCAASPRDRKGVTHRGRPRRTRPSPRAQQVGQAPAALARRVDHSPGETGLGESGHAMGPRLVLSEQHRDHPSGDRAGDLREPRGIVPFRAGDAVLHPARAARRHGREALGRIRHGARLDALAGQARHDLRHHLRGEAPSAPRSGSLASIRSAPASTAASASAGSRTLTRRRGGETELTMKRIPGSRSWASPDSARGEHVSRKLPLTVWRAEVRPAAGSSPASAWHAPKCCRRRHGP